MCVIVTRIIIDDIIIIISSSSSSATTQTSLDLVKQAGSGFSKNKYMSKTLLFVLEQQLG